MFRNNFFSKFVASLLLVVMVGAGLTVGFGMSEVANAQEVSIEAPKYVFYFIGDGLGASQRQLAEFYKQEVTGDKTAKLIMNTFPIAGLNTTYSADTLVTDSAAAGTALATGYKTNNGMISVLPDGVTEVKSLIEEAEAKGMATGLISTTRITHATPAVFASHNVDRNDENGIAEDYVKSGVDFIAGGGFRHFLPQNWGIYEPGFKSKRKDDKNLIGEFGKKGYKLFYGEKGCKYFDDYEPEAGDKVFATFTYSHMPYELDRVNDPENKNIPSIADITQKAIDVLSSDEDGFFMMVEGGRIDHACHANDAAGSVHDTLAFDAAIKKAYDFYLAHPNETLITVVGDHETGGMGLGFAKNYFLNLNNLTKQKASFEDIVNGIYDGDRDAYYTYIAKNLGLNDLTAKEKAQLERAMDIVDNGEDFDVAAYGPDYYGPVGVTTTHIISERANIQWTTYAHSGTAIPMSALGVGADNFGGFKDNTQIAETMADVMGFELTK